MNIYSSLLATKIAKLVCGDPYGKSICHLKPQRDLHGSNYTSPNFCMMKCLRIYICVILSCCIVWRAMLMAEMLSQYTLIGFSYSILRSWAIGDCPRHDFTVIKIL